MRAPRFPEAKPYTVKRLTVVGKDELGGDIEDWQGEDIIMAEIQPLQGNQTRGEMGVTEKSTHKAFSLGTFESNTRLIGSGDDAYLVGYIQDWGNHREAVLEYVQD